MFQGLHNDIFGISETSESTTQSFQLITCSSVLLFIMIEVCGLSACWFLWHWLKYTANEEIKNKVLGTCFSFHCCTP